MKILKMSILFFFLFGTGYFLYNKLYIHEEKPKIIIGAREVTPTPIDKGTIFISPKGENNKECNYTNPCNLNIGIKKSKSGDIVFFKGGIYDISSIIKNSKKRVKLNNGSKEKPIIYESYPNELAIFDGKNLQQNELGSIIVRNYTHLRRVEVRNMKKVGIKIRGNYNIIEGVNSHHNKSAGVHIYNKNGYKNSHTGSYNIIKDCTIHHNSDTNTKYKGENADGISISSGKNNLITHNTVYANSDDGIDTWKSINTTIEYSISYNNGKGNGDGNGFKLGGDNNKSSPLGVGAIAKYNIAYNNKHNGFTENAGRKILIKNNIAYNNGNYGFTIFDKNSSIINNIAYKNKKKEFYGNENIALNNSWQQQKNIKNNDFISLNPKSINFLKPTSNNHLSTIGPFVPKNNNK